MIAIDGVDRFELEGAVLYHCDHRTLARALHDAGEHVDALIVDAPYSEVTHAGHNAGTSSANRVADWAARVAPGTERGAVRTGNHTSHSARARSAMKRVARGGTERRLVAYAAWTPADVDRFVSAWSPLVSDWMISITDHVLARAWDAEMRLVGRYTFSPIACVEPGSRARFTGDGPPQWSCWAVVGRPRSADWLRWWHDKREEHGLAPRGAYVVPVGAAESGSDGGLRSERVPGGKPLWLLRAMVQDYTAPGELVCDPCAGSATTLIAAATMGRRAIGSEPDRKTYDDACARMRRHLGQRDLFREQLQSSQEVA